MDWNSRNNDQENSMKGEKKMPKHKTGTREEWLATRVDLLKAENTASFTTPIQRTLGVDGLWGMYQ